MLPMNMTIKPPKVMITVLGPAPLELCISFVVLMEAPNAHDCNGALVL
jgi:hypothetical protein